MKKIDRNSERGVALLMAIFALMLLAAIGLAMMYGANTETKINANFRDKQVAVYAAQSGALEARARIHPVTGDIDAPGGIPMLGAANVIYILNPGAGESASDIQPWNPDNKYFDTELCQERIMGLSGTAGVPCTTAPAGSGWYTTVTAADPTALNGNPLNFKWARIQLKTNSNTPVATDGSTTTSTQVCYDGAYQYLLETGASTNCVPTGKVTAVILTNPGTGYTSQPTVTIAAPGGTGVQATADAIFNSTPAGQIASITVDNQGSGYTQPPIVTLIGGDGTGATAIATINPPGAPVDSISFDPSTATGCYAPDVVPNVTISPTSGGSGATAHAEMTTDVTCIYAFTLTGSCASHKGSTDTYTAGGTWQGSASYAASGGGNVDTASVHVTNPGSGYTSAPTSGWTSALGCNVSKLTFANFQLGKKIASIVLDTGGSGYTSAPPVTIDPPIAGTTPTATTTLGSAAAGAGKIDKIMVTNGGSGYTIAPLVVITPADGNGGGGTATASLTAVTEIAGINVVSQGSGYMTAPTVTISGGGGTGATAKAIIGGGAYDGQVFLITSMAMAPGGSKAMTQMEIAANPFSPGGPLILDGSSPNFGSPTSQNFYIDGHDLNSCGEYQKPPKHAVGVYDDPANPTSPSSQDIISDAVARPDHYIGSGDYPDVENAFNDMGPLNTVSGAEAFANAIASIPGASVYSTDPGTVQLGTATNPSTIVVNGDLTLNGNTSGYGILLVRGTLTVKGSLEWNGLIYVIGEGVMDTSGGGGVEVHGSVLVAKTRDSSGNLLSTMGSPTFDWTGGGGNGIYYDHCWADKMFKRIPYNPPPSVKPLKILSTRTVTY